MESLSTHGMAAVVPYDQLPKDWMAPGEVARTFGLLIDVPVRQIQPETGMLGDHQQQVHAQETQECESRPQTARVVKVIAALGLAKRLGRLEDGRVTRYVTPQEANQIFDYFFPEGRTSHESEPS